MVRRNADNGRIRQVLTQDFVGPSNKAVLKHYAAAICIQIHHRITQLIIYLAGFKTPTLKAAGVDNMANLPKKMKKALFHLAAKVCCVMLTKNRSYNWFSLIVVNNSNGPQTVSC